MASALGGRRLRRYEHRADGSPHKSLNDPAEPAVSVSLATVAADNDEVEAMFECMVGDGICRFSTDHYEVDQVHTDIVRMRTCRTKMVFEPSSCGVLGLLARLEGL